MHWSGGGVLIIGLFGALLFVAVHGNVRVIAGGVSTGLGIAVYKDHLVSTLTILPRLPPFPFRPFFLVVGTARLPVFPLLLAAGEGEPEPEVTPNAPASLRITLRRYDMALPGTLGPSK